MIGTSEVVRLTLTAGVTIACAFLAYNVIFLRGLDRHMGWLTTGKGSNSTELSRCMRSPIKLAECMKADLDPTVAAPSDTLADGVAPPSWWGHLAWWEAARWYWDFDTGTFYDPAIVD